MPPAQVMRLLISWLIKSAKYRSALTSFTPATCPLPNYFRDQTQNLSKEEWEKHLRYDVKRNHNWNIPFFDNCRVFKIAILITIFSLTKGFIWILLRWHCLSQVPWGKRSCEHWALGQVNQGVTGPLTISGKLQSRIDDSGSGGTGQIEIMDRPHFRGYGNILYEGVYFNRNCTLESQNTKEFLTPK